MTQFVTEGFDYHAGCLYYLPNRYKREFVARFKYGNPLKSKNAFQKFLIANFTVEEYFAQRNAGIAPATILETKGYLSPNLQAAIKADPSIATSNSLIAAIIARKA